MLKSRSGGLRCVVLSLSLGLLLWGVPLYADDAAELAPPAESGDTGLSPVENPEASAGAELPPPPELAPAVPPPSTTAELAPADSSEVATPPGEEIPALPPEGDRATNNEVPPDSGLTDVPPAPLAKSAPTAPTQFSSSNELKDVAMEDRIKSKDLVLWLSLGPSYGTLTNKGAYQTAPGAAAVGGLGYNAGVGFMLDNFFQLQFDFTGTPLTKNTTVDHAMFGFGPRLGFITLMGVFGVQQGPDPTGGPGSVGRIFSIGARAGLDLVLKHSADSRVSVGISPEAYYITPQTPDGYNSTGITVSLRIYGYDSAF